MTRFTKKRKPGKTPQFSKSKILKLVKSGEKYAKIAEEIGCSEAYVGQIALNSGEKRYGVLDHDKIKKRILAGEKYTDIANAECCHVSTVGEIARKMGIMQYKGKPGPRKLVTKSSYLELLQKASTEKRYLKDLAGELGWSATAISNMVAVLENRGLVARVFRGRYRDVILTDEGKRVLKEVGE